jgi:hypothetical protein
MNEPTTPRSETTQQTSPFDDGALGQPRAPRARTRTRAALLLTSFVAALAACEGASEPSPTPSPMPNDDAAYGTVQQDLSAASCRQDLRGCLSNASGASSLAECTLDFEDCFSQAALERVGHGKLLAQCRATADGCLSGAVDASDISACGEVLTDCADDVRDQTRNVFTLVTPIVSRVLKVGVRSVRGVFDVIDGLPAIALSSVRTCRAEVTDCVDSAVGDLDIGACAQDLDVCVAGVVDIIDPALDALPGPSPSEILTGTDACRSDAQDCVVGALSLNDIRACGDVLGTCVDDVAAILDDTVDDVNDIVDPLPVAVPKPSNVVDCTLALTQCLVGLNNPFDCTEQARICATQ